MGETLAVREIMLGTLAAAGIVLAGAFYAAFFALARLQQSRSWNIASLISFAALAAAVVVLARALSLSGFWLGVATVMVVGYFVAPRAIWNLCVGTHAGETQAGGHANE